jgi:membrane protease YdiL (CAAX protease family)
MNSLAGASLGVFLFVGVRGLDQVGYRFQSSRDELRIALRNFVLFIPLALVIGFASGFLSIAKHFATPQEMVLSTVGVFILIAIPEELLFRGIIQNLMHRMIPNPFWSLFLSSLIFGASHLNNGPRPDWRYFLLATLAGAFYGDAYRKTQKLISPAILHTLVDVAWRSFFR